MGDRVSMVNGHLAVHNHIQFNIVIETDFAYAALVETEHALHLQRYFSHLL